MPYYNKFDKKKPQGKKSYREETQANDFRYAKTNRYSDEQSERPAFGRSGKPAFAPKFGDRRGFQNNERADRFGKGERRPYGEKRERFNSRFEDGKPTFGRAQEKPGFQSVERFGGRFDNKKQGFERPSVKPRYPKDERRFEDRKPGRFSGVDGVRHQPAQPPRRPFAPYAAPVESTAREEENRPDENLLFGRNPIREALKAGRDIEKMLVAEGDLSGSAREIVSMARKAGIKVQIVEKQHLDTFARNHQGLVAFASAYQYAEVDDILAAAKEKNEKPFILILDQITDPHNLGAIIRTAACTGAHGVIIPRNRAVGLSSVAVKTSSGAVEYVKVARVTNLSQIIKQLKKLGIWVYAADMAGKDARKMDFSEGTALVIGNEGDGVSPLVQSQCDDTVSLPMVGEIASLNASVAAGVLMYTVFTFRHPAE